MTNTGLARERNFSMDVLRVLACVLVMWQHASEYYYSGDRLHSFSSSLGRSLLESYANALLFHWFRRISRARLLCEEVRSPIRMAVCSSVLRRLHSYGIDIQQYDSDSPYSSGTGT